MEAQKQNKSQLAIMDSAKTLFWKFGVKRVSIEEICKHAGISKMTFYRLFKNKVELVNQMLVNISDEGWQSYITIMDSSNPFPEKVKLLLLEKHKSAKGISTEFMQDVFMAPQPEWQATLEHGRKEMLDKMRLDFTAAQKEGWIRKELSMEFIFYMLEDMQQKARDEKFLALHGDNVTEAIMEMTQFFFYGVMTNKTSES